MNIAILGYGIEGESAWRYLSQQYPDASFAVYDQNETSKTPVPDGVAFHGGVVHFHDIDADIVVRTPGIPPQTITTRGELTSVTKLFFENCPAPIIGVTGSKGKGTTSSLIASILNAASKTVHLIGNIGEPALDALAQVSEHDVVVYELSSFQLWDLERSPQTAVVLMVEPDHLDVHSSMNEYVAAKSNIAAHQIAGDRVVYFQQNDISLQIATQSPAEKIPFPDQLFAHVDEDFFWYGREKLCSVDNLKLPGEHNQSNACAAIAAAWPWVQDGETIAQGLRGFTGLPHRLKYVAEKNGVKYYDDSIATTPGSAIAAVNAFREPKVLILGGSSKGADFTELADTIKANDIRTVLLIGSEAPRIAKALDVSGVAYEQLPDATMPDVVQHAAKLAQHGDVVILSPACASFGMFKNYKDRGDQFIAAVEKL